MARNDRDITQVPTGSVQATPPGIRKKLGIRSLKVTGVGKARGVARGGKSR